MELHAYNRILHEKHLKSPAFNINWLALSKTSLLTAVRSWEYFESNKKCLINLMKKNNSIIWIFDKIFLFFFIAYHKNLSYKVRFKCLFE